MSEFMKYLNSVWARNFCAAEGGKGYVFQGRFKSTIIEEEAHLETALCYVLSNPIRAGLVDNPWAYRNSSIHGYFGRPDGIVDYKFVRELFPTKKDLNEVLGFLAGKDLNLKTTRIGPVLGSEKFIAETIALFDRRKNSRMSRRMRIKEEEYPDVETLQQNFEKTYRIDLNKIDLGTVRGKRMRAKFLVMLRENGGLTYSQIVRHPLFKKLKLSSMSHMYTNIKRAGK